MKTDITAKNFVSDSGESAAGGVTAVGFAIVGFAGAATGAAMSSCDASDKVTSFGCKVGTQRVTGRFGEVTFAEGDQIEVVGRLSNGTLGVLAAIRPSDRTIWMHPHCSRGSEAYLSSSYAFGGTVITGLASGAGFAANTLVARGVGGVVVETIAARAGASAVLATVGGTALTVSGIGLILLGAGVALQVGAVVLTPTPLQRWLSRSHFGRDPSIFDWDGKRDDMFVKGDWKAEFAAFQEALAVAGKEAPPKPSLVDKVKAVVSP